MDELTKRFLKAKFQSHYKNLNLQLPPSFVSREWGFISFDPMPDVIMKRHKYFGSFNEVSEYLIGMAPAHVYYSVAYYDMPGAPRMDQKGWRGADLIFDLDADHLPGVKMTYSDMLDHVKAESLKLADFLIDDFGFSENNIQLVFSGGRGYHFHVYDDKISQLDSAERREIVNYVSGRDLDFKFYFKEIAMVGDTGSGSKEFMGKRGKIPTKWVLQGHENGWGKRIAGHVADYLRSEAEIGKSNPKEMFKDLKENKIAGDATLKKLAAFASDEAMLAEITEKGRLDFPVKDFKTIIEYIIQKTVSDFGVDAGANVDEPVTGDIKRLIRFPGSLHGGSGFLVQALSLEQLPSYEPLTDSLAFDDKPTKVRVQRPFSFMLNRQEFSVDVGNMELPEYAAVYLMCRGVANYGY
ncbi:MAG: DNA primase catalytic subunit PriS [Methanosarcinales archaeon]|jgi:DNA primase small subunit|nr:DNA primase catalytic subunit PriS [Methanosarcinales archaeon]